MRTYLLFFVLLFNSGTKLFGHTGYADTVKCPMCSSAVVFHKTMSMTTFGSYMDFQKRGAIGHYYEEMINSCYECKFSGFYSDFNKTYSDTFIRTTNMITEKFFGLNLDDAFECEIAAEIKIMNHYPNDQIANAYLISTYLLRTDSLQTDRRKRLQNKTAEFLLKALEVQEYEKEELPSVYYLIGEMYRRTGNFEKAILYFDLALTDEENHKKKKRKKNDSYSIKSAAVKQKQLAILNDSNNQV